MAIPYPYRISLLFPPCFPAGSFTVPSILKAVFPSKNQQNRNTSGIRQRQDNPKTDRNNRIKKRSSSNKLVRLLLEPRQILEGNLFALDFNKTALVEVRKQADTAFGSRSNNAGKLFARQL